MSATTGKALDAEAELSQSIAVILMTRIGSRLARRDFGSELPALVDQPVNPVTMQRMIGATATALRRWLPSLRISRVQILKGDQPGAWTVQISRPAAGSSAATPLSVQLRF